MFDAVVVSSRDGDSGIIVSEMNVSRLLITYAFLQFLSFGTSMKFVFFSFFRFQNIRNCAGV